MNRVWKKWEILLFILLLIQFTSFIYFCGWTPVNRSDLIKNSPENPVQKLPKSRTIIIMWTKYWWWGGANLLSFIEQGMKSDPNCFCTAPDNNIVVTLNRSLADQAAAIVFHPRQIKLSDLPRKRRPEQIWVLFEHESQVRNSWIKWQKYDGLFNWTMSFRRDSDVWSPYGDFIENEKVIPENNIKMPDGSSLDQWISQKKPGKMMAWVVSNCGKLSYSGRERLVRSLKNLSFPIDTYGACGEKKICNRLNTTCNHTEFWINLAKDYKFYLAAENALCEDYTTEKLWRTLDIGLVPVVYGGADYLKLTPPNSVIDSRDFKSPGELAQFLVEVANDTERYKSYLLWRSKYHIRQDDCWAGFCSLCKKVPNFRKEKSNLRNESKVYHNLTEYWNMFHPGNGVPPKPACSSS